MFEVAVYTDVGAQEAIDGIDGFNFQSVSQGLTGIDQQRIRENLLHRVIPAWGLVHEPLLHPPTCAFMVQDGRFYLSRGISTGDTKSGRPGNQLTQVIVTSENSDFVPYRPAQLFGAAEWSLTKAASRESAPWVTPLQISQEFEAHALRDLVLSDAWSSAILPHFITMIDAATASESRKLVLLHDSLDLIMKWIALGTLFLDVDTAQALQFRAIVEDPWRVDAPIVGVSPELRNSDLGSANVLDLATRLTPNVEPSDSARSRASLFLEQSAEDALNVIETARRWEQILGADLAYKAACLVGVPDSAPLGESTWRTSIVAVEQLAAAGLGDDLTLYAEEFCDATYGYGPTTTEEFAMVGRAILNAHDSGIDALASGMLVPTLEALVAVPAQCHALVGEWLESATPIRWDSSDSRAAASAFLGELLCTAPADALPDLFAAARIIAAPVAEAELRTAIERLASRWAEHPEIGELCWTRWLAADAVVVALGEILVEFLKRGDYSTEVGLLEGRWDFMEPVANGSSFADWLRAAEVARIPADRRVPHIKRENRIPADAWRIALADSDVPRQADLWSAWIEVHGLSHDMELLLSHRVAGHASWQPGDQRIRYSANWGPLMTSLLQASDPNMRGLAEEYSQARRVLRRCRHEVVEFPAASLNECVPFVERVAPFVLADIGWLLINTRNASSFDGLLLASEPWGPSAMQIAVDTIVADRKYFRVIAYGLRFYRHPVGSISRPASEALHELLTANPGLADRALRIPELRRGMEIYLQSHTIASRRKRLPGAPRGRRKER